MGSLAQKVDTIREQLGLVDGRPLAASVDEAVFQLGLADKVKGFNLIQKVDACLATLGTPSASAAAAPVAPSQPAVAPAPQEIARAPQQIYAAPYPSYGQPTYAGTVQTPNTQPAEIFEARSRDKERSWRCSVCGKVFKTEGGKTSHERDVHGMHGGNPRSVPRPPLKGKGQLKAPEVPKPGLANRPTMEEIDDGGEADESGVLRLYCIDCTALP